MSVMSSVRTAVESSTESEKKHQMFSHTQPARSRAVLGQEFFISYGLEVVSADTWHANVVFHSRLAGDLMDNLMAATKQTTQV
jgi:hypothetical protein